MWLTGVLKYSGMEIQFPRKEKTFQQCDDTLKTENEDFSLCKMRTPPPSPKQPPVVGMGRSPGNMRSLSSQTIAMSTLPAQAGEAPQKP